MLPLLLVVLAIALVLLYWFPLRRVFSRWGASDADVNRSMRGDSVLPDAPHSATLAVDIAAPPQDVWPWLVQIGYRRGGLYSYDWLDRFFGYLDGPSAERILPEFQHLAAGDEIPVGGGPGFPVKAIEPGRALVLSGAGDGVTWVWQFGLCPEGATHTRLVSRSCLRTPDSIGWWLFMRVMEPAAFLMTRRMLIGIKRRAERLALTGHVEVHAAA
jgi:hypothetical protein